MSEIKLRKKIVFSATAVVFIYLACELLVFIGYAVARGELFSWPRYQAKRTEVIEESSFSKRKKREQRVVGMKRTISMDNPLVESLHPYLGYVFEANRDDCSEHGFCDRRVTVSRDAPVSVKTNDNFIVGIFGGSFAYQMSLQSTPGLLTEGLGELPNAKDKEITVHTIALGGYKQPQQLIALAYFLSLGAHFDLVINIDGFNEVALPPTENLPKGIFPFYPREWWNRLQGTRDSNMLAMIGRIAVFQEHRFDAAEKMSAAPYRYSVIANLFWEYRNKRLRRREHLMEVELAQYRAKDKFQLPYTATGPAFSFSDDEDLYRKLSRFWRDSSLQMSRLSHANGIPYFHFLQPNQYVPGAKPMSEQEKRISLLEGHPYQISAQQGYAQLAAESATLKQNGVQFHDLTMMFKDNGDVLYADQCCHLNPRGYDLVVHKIVDIIRANIP